MFDSCMSSYDLATASDLKYYALPDLQNRLQTLETKLAEEDAAGETNTVTPEQIAEIVARWTSIPVCTMHVPHFVWNLTKPTF